MICRLEFYLIKYNRTVDVLRSNKKVTMVNPERDYWGGREWQFLKFIRHVFVFSTCNAVIKIMTRHLPSIVSFNDESSITLSIYYKEVIFNLHELFIIQRIHRITKKKK